MAADDGTERRRISGHRAPIGNDPIVPPERLIADHV
jgi:hypothetical protein